MSPRELRDDEVQLGLIDFLDSRISDRIQFEREQPSTSANLPRHLQPYHEAAISEAMCPQRPQRYGVDVGGPVPRPWSPQRPIPPFVGPLPDPGLPPIAIPDPPLPLSAAELADCPPHKENLKKMRPTKPSQDWFRELDTITEDTLELSNSSISCSTLEGFLLTIFKYLFFKTHDLWSSKKQCRSEIPWNRQVDGQQRLKILCLWPRKLRRDQENNKL